jgi:hypothetical protein
MTSINTHVPGSYEDIFYPQTSIELDEPAEESLINKQGHKHTKELTEYFSKNIKNVIIHTYPKYPDSILDSQEYLESMFQYAMEHDEMALAVVASRGLPLLEKNSKDIFLIDERGVNNAWKGYFEKIFNTNFDHVLTYSAKIDKYTGYKEKLTEILTKNPNIKVRTHAPFFDKDVLDNYYIDPKIVARLNDKRYINELSTSTPKRTTITFEDLNNIDEITKNENISFPVWIKNASSAGGDGTIKINNKDEITSKIYQNPEINFSNGETLIIEEHFESDENFNVQVSINADGSFSFIGYSSQVIGEGGVHMGNLIQMDNEFKDLPKTVQKIVEEIVKNAKKVGYIGIAGLDILYNEKQNKGLFIDPNFRPNGSSTPQMTRAKLEKQGYTKENQVTTIVKLPEQLINNDKENVGQFLLDKLSKYIDNKDLIVYGLAIDEETKENLFQIGIFGNTSKNSSENDPRLTEINKIIEELKADGFLVG